MEKSAKSINDLTEPHEERLAGLTDEEILEALNNFEPLPDESDPKWHEPPFALFDRAGLFVALADQVAERHLKEGIGLLLDRACFGDPGEMMRGLRHALEAACDGDWNKLADICAQRSSSTRAGTRLWATSELAILRDPRSIDAIQARLSDLEAWVRREAIRATEMLAQQYLDIARALLPNVQLLARADPDASIRKEAAAAIERLTHEEQGPSSHS